ELGADRSVGGQRVDGSFGAAEHQPAVGAPRDRGELHVTLAVDGEGRAFLSTRGGYFRFDVATGDVTKVDIDGQGDVEFTA
ncbi:hypothetical protein C6A85_10615, partial [Mycobacterium sp. ITM-2017-0098]